MSDLVASASFPELWLACAVFLSVLAVLSIAAGFVIERLLPHRRIFDLPLGPGQLRREAWGTLRYLLLAAPAFAWVLSRVEQAPSTLSSFWLTFGFAWASFEVYYWFLHRAMHTRPLYRFHRFHHDSRVTGPVTGFSMSATESLGWIAGETLPLLALGWLTPISIEGWCAYLVLYHFPGNIVGHVNVELFPSFIQGRGASWLTHPVVYHSLHHARYKRHYGFGSTFMDRLLRTEWPDWPQLHARVVSSRALRQLAERG